MFLSEQQVQVCKPIQGPLWIICHVAEVPRGAIIYAIVKDMAPFSNCSELWITSIAM